jgi:hypothetical protein
MTAIPSCLRALAQGIAWTGVAAVLAACATPPGAAPTATGAPSPQAAASPPPAGAASAPVQGPRGAARPPGSPPPFSEIVQGARSSEGFLTLWTRDDKTWLEIPAARLNQPFFFASSIATGLGERFLWPGLMGREHMVLLRRVGNSVQLVARNTSVRAPAGTPLGLAVAESFSDSLLSAVPLAAAPHPERKSLLVDANALLGGDLNGAQTMLETLYRLPYALDRANSSIERARATPQSTALTFRSHFFVPKLPARPALAPGAPPPNPAALPNPPRNVPDPRSLLLSFTYTLAALPDTPMKTRRADPRVGYFTRSFIDFGDDSQEGRRTHLIERWRLEKKDPTAALSDPKEPIRVVLDRNIPDQWRTPLREAAQEWNKAFERAGFSNALRIEQQPADADWSTLEGTRLLAVRWFAQEGPGSTAVGPSQSDPRTGEILRGAAIIDENRVRVLRIRSGEVLPRVSEQSGEVLPGEFAKRYAQCNYADEAFDQAQFGLELLAARGTMDPDGPEAQRYIAGALKDVTMHEIGHALGLRHNFRASTTVTPAQLRDPAFTSRYGLSSSVMEYNGLNLPLEGETTADYSMPMLGHYDLWAIEYGYKEFADPAQEKQALRAIADRALSDPRLAYATDEDLGNSDPLVNQRDMGNDPLAFSQRQVRLARELWQRTTARALTADDDLTLYRRTLDRVLFMMGASVPVATKYVGGTFTSRMPAGADQALLVPVPAEQQRAALNLVLGEVFSSASFRFDPRFMARLGVDQFERMGEQRGTPVGYSLPTAVLNVQRPALDALMSDALAMRLADAESRVSEPRSLLSYAEVQSRLSGAVWSELGQARTAAPDIDSLRRNLQREHVKRLAGGLVRASSAAAADTRAVYRQAALQLETQLKTALAAPGWTPTARAHLAESHALLGEALRAPLMRQGL